MRERSEGVQELAGADKVKAECTSGVVMRLEVRRVRVSGEKVREGRPVGRAVSVACLVEADGIREEGRRECGVR